jgi:hypothetical protein
MHHVQHRLDEGFIGHATGRLLLPEIKELLRHLLGICVHVAMRNKGC